MPLNFENVMNGMGLLNAAIPGVVKIIATLSDGSEIDLTDLVAKTQKVVDDKLKEAAEHLAKPEE